MPRTRWSALVIWLITMTAWAPQALAQSRHFVVDLTHPIPTFQQGDVGQADLSKPLGNSRPIASFSSQAVLIGLPNFPEAIRHMHQDHESRMAQFIPLISEAQRLHGGRSRRRGDERLFE